MPGPDCFPGVSHLKAAIQAITGDTTGAGRTMDNFHAECPVVSQITSLVKLARGDAKGALETQKRCLSTVNNAANCIPLLGHIKGLAHHAVRDHEGGNKALIAATRPIVVFQSFLAGGVVASEYGAISTAIGAISAGIAAGFIYDGITGANQGCFAAFKNAYDNPSAGAIFDAAFIPVFDGLVCGCFFSFIYVPILKCIVV